MSLSGQGWGNREIHLKIQIFFNLFWVETYHAQSQIKGWMASMKGTGGKKKEVKPPKNKEKKNKETHKKTRKKQDCTKQKTRKKWHQKKQGKKKNKERKDRVPVKITKNTQKKPGGELICKKFGVNGTIIA